MNGQELLTIRTVAGLTRPKLLPMLVDAGWDGLTIAKLAGIESRNVDLEDWQLRCVEKALRIIGTVPAGYTPVPESELPQEELPAATEAVDEFDTGTLVLKEWCGLKEGDPIKVEGQVRATFTFGFYFKSPAQEYVQVTGGKKGHKLVRCFRPETIRTIKGRPVMK